MAPFLVLSLGDRSNQAAKNITDITNMLTTYVKNPMAPLRYAAVVMIIAHTVNVTRDARK